ncbi:hypothetical protein J1614_005843 [Plenodomus biglobosus]|nr:hypothetical protein J1614_005843 [Plenodomus biglobosus]
MEYQAPMYQPSQESLMPTTEGTHPETPKFHAASLPESATSLDMSKLPTPDRVKFTSPTPQTTASLTPPPSSQLPGARTIMRTPTPPTPQLTSPPPTSKLPSQPPALLESAAALYSPDQVNNASAEELRAMVNSLSNAFRDMRLSAAHYKLQYNMAVMESQEAASRMAVELAMAQRELDVLQQAEAKRRDALATPEQIYQESANAANAILMSEMNRQSQMLQSENEELRDLFEQQKRLTEHREGELASLLEENDRLKTRIRMNRDHIAPLLEQIEQSSPRSVYGTPHQPTPRNRVSRVPPHLQNQDSRGQNNFEALLLADKMLSQETSTAPATPTTSRAPRARFGHHRGAQSMSSLPQTPNRRTAQPRAEVPRTPPVYIPNHIPQSAPPAHYQQKPVNNRRQSSNSTITASSIDEEEAFTDREEDEVPESQASQVATSLLRQPPPAKGQMAAPSLSATHLVQSKIFGQVKKGHGLSRSGDAEKRRHPSEQYTSPQKRGRTDHGVGLGIGGLLRE